MHRERTTAGNAEQRGANEPAANDEVEADVVERAVDERFGGIRSANAELPSQATAQKRMFRNHLATLVPEKHPGFGRLLVALRHEGLSTKVWNRIGRPAFHCTMR